MTSRTVWSRMLLLGATAASMLALLHAGRGMIAWGDVRSSYERDLDRLEAALISPIALAQVASSPALQDAMLGTMPGSHVPVFSVSGGTCWLDVWTTPWSEQGTTLPLHVAIAPRLSSQTPRRLIVAVPGTDPARTGIYRSGDNGLRWAFAPVPIHPYCNEPLYYEDLAVSPADPNRFYLTVYCWEVYWPFGARAFYSVYTSPDAGVSWQQIRGGGDGVWIRLKPSPVVPMRVYVMDGSGRWYQSENGGQSWTERSFPVDILALDAQNALRLKGIQRHSISGHVGKRSNNGGNTWVEWSQQPCLSSDLVDIVAHPTDPNVLFMRCDQGLLRSRDGGDSWETLSPSAGQFLTADYGNPGRILWGTGTDVLSSTDQGTTWSSLIPEEGQRECPSLAVPSLLRDW